MFTINTAAVADSFAEIMPRFLRISPRTTVQGDTSLAPVLQAALERFNQTGGACRVDFLDLPFLESVAAPVIADYLQGRCSRQDAAVEIARRRDAELIVVNSTKRKRRMADAVMAIDYYLALLPLSASE